MGVDLPTTSSRMRSITFIASRCVKIGVLITAAVSVLLVSSASAGTTPAARLETAARYFRTAERSEPGSAVRRSYYLKVERLAESLVTDAPDIAEGHFLLFAARGRRLLDESGKPSPSNFWKFSGLNKHLSRTLELDPSHAHALAAKGGLLLDLPSYLGGDVKAAQRHLERAVQLNPTGANTRLTLARALVRQGLRQPARDQALLAAHYACLRRKQGALRDAERLLASLDRDSL
jgi:hypothetical protein